jgi:hypothetical protein
MDDARDGGAGFVQEKRVVVPDEGVGTGLAEILVVV